MEFFEMWNSTSPSLVPFHRKNGSKYRFGAGWNEILENLSLNLIRTA